MHFCCTTNYRTLSPSMSASRDGHIRKCVGFDILTHRHMQLLGLVDDLHHPHHTQHRPHVAHTAGRRVRRNAGPCWAMAVSADRWWPAHAIATVRSVWLHGSRHRTRGCTRADRQRAARYVRQPHAGHVTATGNHRCSQKIKARALVAAHDCWWSHACRCARHPRTSNAVVCRGRVAKCTDAPRCIWVDGRFRAVRGVGLGGAAA